MSEPSWFQCVDCGKRRASLPFGVCYTCERNRNKTPTPSPPPRDPIEAILAVECTECTVAAGCPCYMRRLTNPRGNFFCASRIRTALTKTETR